MKIIRLEVPSITVIDALEYTKSENSIRKLKQPDVTFEVNKLLMRNDYPYTLKKDSLTLKIKDRYVLLDFFRALFPKDDIGYQDMMYTIYEDLSEDKPYFMKLIQQHIDNSDTEYVSLYVKGQEIKAVSTEQSKSQYINETSTIISSILADACDARWSQHISSTRMRKKYGTVTWMHPLITYQYDDKCIEVLSAHHKTYFTSRVKVGDGWVQPSEVVCVPKWGHMIDTDTLVDILHPMVKILEETSKSKPNKNKYGDRASRLNFTDRNKLERDDYFHSFRKY